MADLLGDLAVGRHLAEADLATSAAERRARSRGSAGDRRAGRTAVRPDAKYSSSSRRQASVRLRPTAGSAARSAARSRPSSSSRYSSPSNATRRGRGRHATISSPIGEAIVADGDVEQASAAASIGQPVRGRPRARLRLGPVRQSLQIVRVHLISSLSFFVPWYTFARAASSLRAHQLGDLRDTAGRARGGARPRPAGAGASARTASHSASSGVGSTAGVARSGGSAVGSGRRAPGPVVIDRLARRDPQDPPVQPFAVRERGIRAQRRQERLLEAVVRVVRTDGHRQEPVDRGAVRLQEVLERRHRRSSRPSPRRDPHVLADPAPPRATPPSVVTHHRRLLVRRHPNNDGSSADRETLREIPSADASFA